MSFPLDGHKLLHHLDRLIPWSEGERIFPLYVAFSPTSLCQCSCSFCPFHSQKKETPISFFPMERFISLVDELKVAGVKALFFSGTGEPLLHPQIYEMIEVASNAGLSVALNTNGLNLDPKKTDILLNHLEWCRFSINGPDKQSYAKVHGVSEDSFKKVTGHLETLAQQKRLHGGKCTIGVQSLYLGQNEKNLILFLFQLKKIGIDYFSLKPFLQHSNSFLKESVIPSVDLLEKLEKMSSESFQVTTRASFVQGSTRDYRNCLSFDFMCEIDAKGSVYTCGAQVGTDDFCYGSLLKESFLTLWKGEKRQERISYIYKNFDVKNCMPHCRHHEINRWLWSYRNPPAHRNFI